MINNENIDPKLPNGWIRITLGEIAEVITGRTPSKKEAYNYGNYIPLVKPPELNDGIISSANDNLSEEGAKKARILPPKSVLVSCIGILGKTGINKIPIAFNQQINAIIFPDEVVPEYGFYYFQTSQIKKWLNQTASATTISIVNKSKFQKAPFLLAPFPEQCRIVSKIDELFTKLDYGVKSLTAVKSQLEHYHQSVLRDAFEGRLTQEWREKHKDQIEPASTLLKRIKDDRKKNIQNYRELPSLDSSKLPPLPENWVWIRPADVATINPGFPCGNWNKERKGVPHLRPMNIDEQGRIVLSKLKFVEITHYDHLMEGDVLFNNTNSPKLLGKTAYIKKNTNWAYSNHMTRLRFNTNYVNPAWISFCLHNLFFNGYFKLYCTHHVNQASINSTFLGERVIIPFPPLNEQDIIVKEIEHRFSIIDEIEKTIKQNLKRSERLRQSILKRAFEGKLVPQDQTDEPTEKLLERIKKEKAKYENELKNKNRMNRGGLMRFVK